MDSMYGGHSSLGVVYCFVLPAPHLNSGATQQFLAESRAVCPCLVLVTQADAMPRDAITASLQVCTRVNDCFRRRRRWGGGR